MYLVHLCRFEIMVLASFQLWLRPHDRQIVQDREIIWWDREPEWDWGPLRAVLIFSNILPMIQQHLTRPHWKSHSLSMLGPSSNPGTLGRCVSPVSKPQLKAKLQFFPQIAHYRMGSAWRKSRNSCSQWKSEASGSTWVLFKATCKVHEIIFPFENTLKLSLRYFKPQIRASWMCLPRFRKQ